MHARHHRLAALLDHGGYTSVHELAERLGVSTVTIRRDLARLAGKDGVMRVRGGAVSDGAALLPRAFMERSRMRHQQPQKEAIARAAAALVHDGDTVALDTGTTAVYVARALCGHRVTVVTNNVPAVGVLGGGPATVVVTGGTLRSEEGSLVGAEALEIIRRFRFDLFFLGSGGLSGQGLTDSNVMEVEVKREFLRRSQRTYAIVDSSKFGRSSGMVVADVADIAGLICDASPDAGTVAALTRASVHLIVAGEGAEAEAGGGGGGRQGRVAGSPSDPVAGKGGTS